MKKMLIIMLLASVLLVVAGCESAQETRATWANTINRLEVAVQGVEQQIDTVEQAIADNQATVEAIREAYPDAAENIDDAIETATQTLDMLQEKRGTLLEEVRNARTTLESIPENASAAQINAEMTGKAIQGVSTVLPPPYNAIAVGLGTLVASAGGLFGLIGTRKAKKTQIELDDTNEAFESTVVTLENAKRTVPELAEGFNKAGAEINNNMPVKAQQKVEAIRNTVGKVSS